MANPIAAPRGVWCKCMCRVAVLAVLGGLLTGCAHVQTTTSWPELLPRLPPGKPVTVRIGSGTEVAGRVSAVSVDSISLSANGAVQQFAASDVRQVRRNGDSLWNGMAIGAAIGLTAAALPDPRYYDCGGSALCTDKQIPQRLTFVAGATIAGILIDALRRDRTILYRSGFTPSKKVALPTQK